MGAIIIKTIRHTPKDITKTKGACRKHSVGPSPALWTLTASLGFLGPLFPLLSKEGERCITQPCKEHQAQYTITMIHFPSDKLPKGQEQQWINASTGTLLETQPYSLHFKAGRKDPVSPGTAKPQQPGTLKYRSLLKNPQEPVRRTTGFHNAVSVHCQCLWCQFPSVSTSEEFET